MWNSSAPSVRICPACRPLILPRPLKRASASTRPSRSSGASTRGGSRLTMEIPGSGGSDQRRYAVLVARHAHSADRRRHADLRLRGRRGHRLTAPGRRRPADRRPLVHPDLAAARWSNDSGDADLCRCWRARPLTPACAGDWSLAFGAARRCGDGSGGLDPSRLASSEETRNDAIISRRVT